ncbi:MAG: tRNA epoxyqueuosine(34) reductase QueG [Gammaproteobacteria bacterium]
MPPDFTALKRKIQDWARELGFQQCGVADVDLADDEHRLLDWLKQKRHGEMDYMLRHGTRRSRPAELVPGTLRVISVRMDYWSADTKEDRHPSAAQNSTASAAVSVKADQRRPLADRTHSAALLDDECHAYVSRYALGRDYHKLIRKRLQKLAEHIHKEIGPFGYRAFTDSAPILEKALARNAGLGWIGKHSVLINKDAGSWFFLGELFTDLPLPVDKPAEDHCGTCHACIDACPTHAIVAPYQVDARRCISYLTIEFKGSIPVELRKPMGNRVFGCDDCQLVCPWNKFAQRSHEDSFKPRHGLDNAKLAELFLWTEAEFLARTEGSAIRRAGYECWLRNLAVGLGNAPSSPEIIAALESRADYPSELVREHIAWALDQHRASAHPTL